MHSAPALRNRPALAAEIATAIGVWGEIEHTLALTLAEMLGADLEIGLEIFFTIQADAPKRAVMEKIAEKSVPRELRAKLSSFRTQLKNDSKGRNKLAHALWGIADKHPDELLWMDTKDTAATFVSGREPAVNRRDLNIWRYSLDDLREITETGINLLGEISKLLDEVRDHAERRRLASL